MYFQFAEIRTELKKKNRLKASHCPLLFLIQVLTTGQGILSSAIAEYRSPELRYWLNRSESFYNFNSSHMLTTITTKIIQSHVKQE